MFLLDQGQSFHDDDGSFTPEAMASLKSVESGETTRAQRTGLRPSTGGGRRFSNVSNLAAFQLSSTTTSAPRLQAGGSLELGFVFEDGPVPLASKNSSRPSGADGLSAVRRTLSALETSTGPPAEAASTASAPQYDELMNKFTHLLELVYRTTRLAGTLVLSRTSCVTRLRNIRERSRPLPPRWMSR